MTTSQQFQDGLWEIVFSAISERHVVQLTLNLEGVRHLELLKFGGPIVIGHATLHLILFAVSKFRMLHSEDLGIFKVLENLGHVQASDCESTSRDHSCHCK